jgi:hypothetical protein
MLTSDQKGAIAETAIIDAGVKLGIPVFKPVNDGERCDLIFDLGPRLVCVQCKWAARRGDVISVRCYSSRRRRERVIRRSYTSEDVDAIAAYCPDLDRCYLLPFEAIAGRYEVSLRLGPPRNGQTLGIRWARDFELSRLNWERSAGP